MIGKRGGTLVCVSLYKEADKINIDVVSFYLQFSQTMWSDADKYFNLYWRCLIYIRVYARHRPHKVYRVLGQLLSRVCLLVHLYKCLDLCNDKIQLKYFNCLINKCFK